MEVPVRTEIKYNKTSCYFCNEWLENDNFKDHLANCGQVLEKCPNNCLAYVQRLKLEEHLRGCPKGSAKISLYTGDELNQRFCILEEDILKMRSILNEELHQRYQIVTEFGALKKKNQMCDEWTEKLSDVLNKIKVCLNEETTIRCKDVMLCNTEIDKLNAALNEIQIWKSSFLDLEMNAKINEHNDNINMLLNSRNMHLENINRMESKLAGLSISINDSNNVNKKDISVIHDKLKTIDSVLLGQNNTIQQTYSITEKNIEQTYANINQQFMTKISELSHRQAKMDVEVKSLMFIIHETEDKCEKFEKILNEYKCRVSETQQKLDNLEVHLKYQNQLMGITNTRGHLIWKIDKYAEKLKEAKQNETMLRSPLFCNQHYGYTLRLDVHLNGIGNWKGRNLIACLTVVNGEYDSLLPWPCKLEADIILRDQPENLSNSKNFYKTIFVKKKNELLNTNQYIHIPHKTIDSGTFLKNDSIMLEVRIHVAKKR